MAKTTRHPAHVEEIRPGVAGLYLGEAADDADGDAGYALVRDDGAIQWTAEDCREGTFSHFELDPTTGAYILPDEADA